MMEVKLMELYHWTPQEVEALTRWQITKIFAVRAGEQVAEVRRKPAGKSNSAPVPRVRRSSRSR